MTRFNISYLKFDARFPYYGWDIFHDYLSDKSENNGHLIRKRSEDDGKILTFFKTHRCSFYYPGREFWGRIRAKIKFAVEEGSIDSWEPIFAIGTGNDLPKTSEIRPQHYKPCKVTELNSPGRFAASGGREFEHSDYARRGHVIIGFKAVGNAEGIIRARTISMYDN